MTKAHSITSLIHGDKYCKIGESVHQLSSAQVERRTVQVRRPKTDVLPLCHATNHKYHTILPSLTVRWILLNCDDAIFSRQICHPGDCSHDFLPPERNPSVSVRLRHSTVYPIHHVRTKRHCSFINYCLKYYQRQLFYVRNSAILFDLFMSKICCTYWCLMATRLQ